MLGDAIASKNRTGKDFGKQFLRSGTVAPSEPKKAANGKALYLKYFKPATRSQPETSNRLDSAKRGSRANVLSWAIKICRVPSLRTIVTIEGGISRIGQHQGFLSVAVITCASHAQGRRFEPGRKHSYFASYGCLAFVVEVDDTR